MAALPQVAQVGARFEEERPPRKQPSLRNRLRALERLIRWRNLAEPALLEKREELERLRGVYERKRRNAEKAAITRKYLPLRKMEERRILRRLDRLRSTRLEDSQAQEDEVRSLERDLVYVRHFPDGVKYVALFPKSGHTKRAKKLIERYRRRIERAHGEQMTMKTPEHPVEDVDVLDEDTGPVPNRPVSVLHAHQRRDHVHAETVHQNRNSKVSSPRAEDASTAGDMNRPASSLAPATYTRTRQQQKVPAANAASPVRLRQAPSPRWPCPPGKDTIGLAEMNQSSVYPARHRKQTLVSDRSDEHRARQRGPSPDPLLEPDEDESNPTRSPLPTHDDDDEDALDRHIFIARLQLPRAQAQGVSEARRSRGRGRQRLICAATKEASATSERPRV